MHYEERKQDVTRVTDGVIAHCISRDCAMGAGVVIPICRRHPTLKATCRRVRDNGTLAVGQAFRFEDETGVVYNLISKEKVRDNATTLPSGQYYHQLQTCLIQLRDQMVEHQETTLYLPKIGSGLDKGDWAIISRLIQTVFNPTAIDVVVCCWP